jgi:hypothetical protein
MYNVFAYLSLVYGTYSRYYFAARVAMGLLFHRRPPSTNPHCRSRRFGLLCRYSLSFRGSFAKIGGKRRCPKHGPSTASSASPSAVPGLLLARDHAHLQVACPARRRAPDLLVVRNRA